MDIHGTFVRSGVHSPYLVHELLSCENLIGIGTSACKEDRIFLRKQRFFPIYGDSQRIVIKRCFAADDTASVAILARFSRAPTLRTISFHIDGLHHIVVSAGLKPLLFVLKPFFGRNNENGKAAAAPLSVRISS